MRFNIVTFPDHVLILDVTAEAYLASITTSPKGCVIGTKAVSEARKFYDRSEAEAICRILNEKENKSGGTP